ncbi:MAG: ABC transporter transmembrane domain-containing protein, partial [Chitinophagaceae bacterium]
MKHLVILNKYFYKYRYRFLLGILFIIFSNYFRILAPQVSGYVIDEVVNAMNQTQLTTQQSAIVHKRYDFLVQQFIHFFRQQQLSLATITVYAAFILLALAILGGFFMFLMRQTIIVMSRHIEYDQKNEVYQHYQQLNLSFFKQNRTGDLMNRISEDVSRVRMYTGPAVMYVINLTATIGFSLFFMAKQNWQLTMYVLAPLPILAIVIYNVNTVIHRRSEKIQEKLSALTTTAQETYSGIRVIKSFVQEKAMAVFFEENSEQYKKDALS